MIQQLINLTRQVLLTGCRTAVVSQRLAAPATIAPSRAWQGPQPRCWCRYSTKKPEEPDQLSEGERAIADKLRARFKGATNIEVSDISGGCGALYQITIEAEEFRGKRTVLQHRLVNEALAEEIKLMHGLQLNTSVPDKAEAEDKK